jgi:alkylation response protein AidB-like acyl-CoA dehydrogenase
MMYLPMRAAEQLEIELGNPTDPGAVFNYARCAELDDGDEFPEDICRQLDGLDLPRNYVPVRHEGSLTSYETTAQLLRMVARRDLAVAVAHAKTYLGGVCVWVAGNEAQAAALGRTIARGVPVSWGLTERDHGSDLLRGEMVAERVPGALDAYRLTGEKWLINNATRCGVICVLARTHPDGGPRGFSLFLVDKSMLGAENYWCLRKVRTHGNRGADVSGIVLHDAVVDANARVGAEGTGLESVLKGLQVTRTLCAALSLGSGDHALRIAVEFVLGHERYGHRLIDLPSVRRTLARAYADHLLAEAMSIVAFRAVQALTPEMAVIAAATKYLIPTRTEAMIARLRRLLGTHALLRNGHEHGCLGKVERDHRIVSLFDGNTVVNLHALVNVFPILSRAHDKGAALDHDGVHMCCELSQPLPEARLGELALIPRHGSSLLFSAVPAIDELTALAQCDKALAPVASAAQRLRSVLDEVWHDMSRHTPTRIEVPRHSFVLAERLATCLAGIAAVQLWLRNHGALCDRGSSPWQGRDEDVLWRNGRWLHAVLDLVLAAVGDHGTTDTTPHGVLLDVLIGQVQTGRLPSLFGCRLAEAM